MELSGISGLKKTAEYFAVILAAAVIFNIAVVTLLGASFSSSVSFIFGKTAKENFLALLFIEGAFLFGIGALLAGGFSENRMMSTSGPKAAYDIEKLSADRPERRRQQVSAGIALMLVGGVLLLMTIIGIVI
jgi:hypothetical protein